jgi:Putative peptidoglycan binding domain
MRTFFVLICSCALVCAASGATQAKTSRPAATHNAQPARNSANVQHPVTQSAHPTSNSAHVQHAASRTEQPASNSVHVQHMRTSGNIVPPAGYPSRVPTGGHSPHVGSAAHSQPQVLRPQTATAVQPAPPPLTKEQQEEVHAQDQGFRSADQYRKWKETGRVERLGSVASTGAPAGEHGMMATGSGAAGSHAGVHEFPSRHFDLPKTPMPGIENVKFQTGSHIPECEKWRDSRYSVFRNYTATWHDADWWRSHHSRVGFVCGGWYYWHAGYWFPAWGYQSEAVYAYDGPIYAFNNLEPDQVVANVQATLQALGYYHGSINGVLDPATRAALANYQRDHGLYTTSTIDEPTLAALGMA